MYHTSENHCWIKAFKLLELDLYRVSDDLALILVHGCTLLLVHDGALSLLDHVALLLVHEGALLVFDQLAHTFIHNPALFLLSS